MDSESKKTLEDLREQIIDSLGSLTDVIVNDDSMDYSSLLAIARTSGRTNLLPVAYQKILKIEDPKEKSAALVELLDSVDMELNFDEDIRNEEGETDSVASEQPGPVTEQQ